MDQPYSSSSNRRAEEPRPAAAPAPVHHDHTGAPVKRLLIWLLTVLAVLAIVAIGFKGFHSVRADSDIKGNEFQALFLTNGQVYFGKLANVNSDYVKLTNIYYLQVQQTVQPADNKNQTQQPQVSLAKLGSELHGPEDAMYVARSQVLFWENLKNDGKVAQAIQQYQSSKK